MRIYNPFKPHIVSVKINNRTRFAIRKYALWRGWEYLDIEDKYFTDSYPYYFTRPDCILRWCLTDWTDIVLKYSVLTKKNIDFAEHYEELNKQKFILQ